MEGNKIGDEIKQRRKAKKISIRKLGEMAGVSKETIRNVENGLFDVRYSTLTSIAKALDCEVVLRENQL